MTASGLASTVRGRQSTRRNMRSAYEHPDVVRKYLDREVQLQRLFPLTTEEMLAESRMQISPFGVIPKRGQEGKWRLIVDLSSPSELSVNAGVTQDLCSISYTSVDVAASSSNPWARVLFWQRWT